MYWYCPWPLGEVVQDHLTDAGLERFPGRLGQLPEGSLLIYPAPQALMSDPSQGAILLEGYREVLDRIPGNRLIADWRLLGLAAEGLAGWLNGAHACPPARVSPPKPDGPLEALLLRALLDQLPELLDCYLDLELQAELAQTPADSSYRQRLLASLEVDQLARAWSSLQKRARASQAISAQLHKTQAELVERQQQLEQSQQQLDHLQGRLQTLEQQLSEREEAVSAAQAESQAISAQLHQTQAELVERQQQLEQSQQQLGNLQGRLQTLEQQLSEREATASAAQAESQATSEQLHKTQVELESYFLRNCRQAELIEQLEQQQRRSLKLLALSIKKQPSLSQALALREDQASR